MSSIEKDDPQQQQHPAPPPLLGALELATYRRGPFICLTGFHEVALGDAPVCDEGDYSSEDSDGPRPTSAPASAKKKERKKKTKTESGEEGGGGGEDGQQLEQPKRRKGKKEAAAESAAAGEAHGDQQEEEDAGAEKEHWVVCDRCERWRVVPPEFWRGVEADPRPHWFCERARWDVRAWEPFEAACPQR